VRIRTLGAGRSSGPNFRGGGGQSDNSTFRGGPQFGSELSGRAKVRIRTFGAGQSSNPNFRGGPKFGTELIYLRASAGHLRGRGQDLRQPETAETTCTSAKPGGKHATYGGNTQGKNATLFKSCDTARQTDRRDLRGGGLQNNRAHRNRRILPESKKFPLRSGVGRCVPTGNSAALTMIARADSRPDALPLVARLMLETCSWQRAVGVPGQVLSECW
jgi:hypothetical protein